MAKRCWVARSELGVGCRCLNKVRWSVIGFAHCSPGHKWVIGYRWLVGFRFNRKMWLPLYKAIGITNMEIEAFITQALSFQGAIQKPHFDRISFKVANKRIFATLHEKTRTANIKLNPIDQKSFCEYSSDGIFPVPNKWGQQGWTTFELDTVEDGLIMEALHMAYEALFHKP